MIEFFSTFLGSLSVELKLVLVSMVPVIELRGAIPMGISLGVEPLRAFLICLGGSMIPVPFIMFGIRPIFNWLQRTAFFRKRIDKISARTLHKGRNIKKYGFWGLILFVAIPLPGTGVWSGTLAAVLLNMRFKLAFIAIFIGNIIAGTIVALFSRSVIM